MDNILITGADGQLGSELKQLSQKYGEAVFHFTDVQQLDITSEEAIESFVSEHSITKIINCAAYNDVDGAEVTPDAAIRLNTMGPANLAAVAARHDIWLIHISTDFVFEGKKRNPYHESDKPCPISEYGRTKLGGEYAVKKAGCKSIIIRTSWLYSPFGAKNFVKTILKLGMEHDSINVVYDQVGSPTYAKDLAAAILHILPQLDATPRYGEVFHYADEGQCSRAAFAEKILNLDRLECEVVPVSSEEYPTRASRPQYSALDKSMIKKIFGVQVPAWERSLSKAIRLFE